MAMAMSAADARSPFGLQDMLSLIYNGNDWHIHYVHRRVCSHVDFNIEPYRLLEVSSIIRQEVVHIRTLQHAADVRVTVEENPHLRRWIYDPPALVVRVTVKPGRGMVIKPYMGIFMTWGMRRPMPKWSRFPYFLDSGDAEVANTVRTMLSTLFECHIRLFTFMQKDILMITFHFVEVDVHDRDAIMLFISTKPDVPNFSPKSLPYRVCDAKLLWNRMKKKYPNTASRVDSTYQVMTNQGQPLAAINIGGPQMELVEVKMPKARIARNGIIKMKTLESVKVFLEILNEIEI